MFSRLCHFLLSLYFNVLEYTCIMITLTCLSVFQQLSRGRWCAEKVYGTQSTSPVGAVTVRALLIGRTKGNVPPTSFLLQLQIYPEYFTSTQSTEIMWCYNLISPMVCFVRNVLIFSGAEITFSIWDTRGHKYKPFQSLKINSVVLVGYVSIARRLDG